MRSQAEDKPKATAIFPEATLVVGKALPEPPTFDTAHHVTESLEGLTALLDELDGVTPPGHKLRGLKLRLGVFFAYLAVLTQHLSPEEQQEVKELANELVKSVSKNPKSDM